MLRKKREVTEPEEIFGILNKCNTIRIAMKGKDWPYVVPVSFGMEIINGKAVIYFHCAKRGMKVDLLTEDPRVCIEADSFIKIEKTAHGITTRYESVIGFGTCSFVTDPEEVIHGLQLLTEHYGYAGYPLDRCKGLDHVLVGKIEVSELTGKRNLPEDPAAADAEVH